MTFCNAFYIPMAFPRYRRAQGSSEPQSSLQTCYSGIALLPLLLNTAPDLNILTKLWKKKSFKISTLLTTTNSDGFAVPDPN